MACGDLTDYMFPMEAEIYHPIVEQSAGYGTVKKSWIADRSIACSFVSSNPSQEEIKPNVNITQDTTLIGRIKNDSRLSDRGSKNSITNVIFTNITDKNCNPLYVETSGPRAGKSTIFEVASQTPFIGPFGGISYYNVVLKRSENQAADL